MTYQHILYDVESRIATITLNRPDRMNAWTPTVAARDEILSFFKQRPLRRRWLTVAGLRRSAAA
jgi:enoyl-CoA hydratase/carnithine racemase